MDELLQQFLIEAPEQIAQASDDLAALAHDPGNRARIDSAFRAIHTLKGSVALFDMAPAGRALHAAEDLLDRARAGKQTLDAENLAAIVAVIDETDRWIEAMERTGSLTGTADGIADGLVARISDGPMAVPSEVAAEPAAWLEALRLREAVQIEAVAADLVAFRYEPDAECFFRGDDPLALAAAVPDLVALAVLPPQPWPALDVFEPFRCNIYIEGLSRASVDLVRTAFRLAPDQVVLAEIAAAASAAPEDIIVAPSPQKGMRVDAERIDALADGIGELIVASNVLAHVAGEVEQADAAIGARVRAAHGEVERALGDMRRAVMAIRMVSLAPTMRRLPRMVREIADGLGKPVAFTMRGEGTEVDKGIADALYEPILHILRNAIDHGIESAEGRRAAGKPDVANLRLEVRREAEQVVIALADDGAGINPARIRDTAVARGLVDREVADAMEDAQAIQLIFAPGFSTAESVSAVSGRGVGLDAVKAAAERLGGSIDLTSVVDTGTTVRLRFPLNAIMTRLLVVRAGGDRYGVPLDRIIETASIPSAQILAVGTGEACVLRERTLPVLSLAALVGGEARRGPVSRLLVTNAAAEPLGVIVDGFEERIDGLVRPRSGILAGVPGVAGTTLLGDGGVLLVLDIAELVA